ncbi:MAG: sulfatase-like hydrolase/transferase, partial [Kiritimatiellaeota bacterium]|nr:sulfatase-like hydrolase/transferase [Kiritimatiellota bacterium]
MNTTSRRDFLKLAGLGALGAAFFPRVGKSASPVFQALENGRQPNILLIVADDLGWADVGWHGGKFLTPNLDRLVKEGIELDRHYVQPVCTPTRTALMSGRWTSRFGPHVLMPSNSRAFPPGTPILASALKQCGYTTHLSGKWHLGGKAEWGPNHYGFDHHGAFEDTWHRDLQRVDEEGNATELVAKEVLPWIKQAHKPWFIYVPFFAVHIPVDAPEEYKRRYDGVKFHDDPVKNDSLLRLAAYVNQLDTKVGEFIAALEATGQRDNTFVIFTSDNGGLPGGKNPYVGKVPDSPMLSSNLPLRGHKNTLYEGGVRVSAFVNWPGRLAPGQLAAPLHAADWMPTLTKLAGWTPPADLKFDGLDIWPLLTGAITKPESRTIYIPHPSGAIVLRDGWKLIARKTTKKNSGGVELYNVT